VIVVAVKKNEVVENEVVEESNPPEPMDAPDSKYLPNRPEPTSASEREHEYEQHYRKQREFEMKDSLALQVLALANDNHTGNLKAKAAEYILTRL
jgi:hypothetical protein